MSQRQKEVEGGKKRKKGGIVFLHPLRKWPQSRHEESPQPALHTHFHLLQLPFLLFFSSCLWTRINPYRSEVETRYLFAPIAVKSILWNDKISRDLTETVRGESWGGGNRASNSAPHKERRRKVSKAVLKCLVWAPVFKKKLEEGVHRRAWLQKLFKGHEYRQWKVISDENLNKQSGLLNAAL